MIATTDRPHVSWITSTTDGYEHAVADEAWAHAREDHADPDTLCGRIMVPTSLAAEIGPRCPSCDRFYQAQLTLVAELPGDQPSWLAWAVHHVTTSWPLHQGGPRPARHGQEPNHGGPAVPRTDGATVLHP